MDKTDFSAFGQYIPGFDFLQSLARQATGVTPGLQPAAGVMPSLGHWVAPTFSVEEIEKRIHDLRAVEFWLDQNAKALAATIQALEVQKMTLATLENMNLSLQDVAESFKIKPETVQAQAAARPAKPAEPVQPAAESAQADSAQAGAKTGVDPMQWWNSLTEQFTTIATSAVQDMAGQAAKAAEQVAQTVQASAEAAEKLAEQARQEAEAAAAARAAAAQQASEQAAASAAARPRPKAAAKKQAATAAKKAASPRPRRKPAAE